MSEDAAYRRAKAAGFARRFPILFDMVAAGEIHLTGLLLLGPHLTEENYRDVLGRAGGPDTHRTGRYADASQLLEQARAHVKAVRADSEASARRAEAQKRAAAERLQRLDAALQQVPEVAAANQEEK